MNPYNPMLDYQRNTLLAQQQMIQNQLNQLNIQNGMNQPPHQQPTFNPYPQSQQPQYFIKQIGSIDEAKAFPVDPAVIYLFPDTGSGKIYLKKMNTENGKSELYIYTPSLEGEVVVDSKDPNEVIIKRLDDIEKSIGGLYESISGNAKHEAGDVKSNRSGSATDVVKNAETKSSKVQSDKTDS